MQKIIIPEAADAQTNHYLAQKGYDVIKVANPSKADLLAHPDVAGAMVYLSPMPNDLYDQLPNLKVLARYGVGYDNIDADYAAKKGVWVTNTPGANAVSVAEAAVTDMLLLAKQSIPIAANMKTNGWTQEESIVGRELTGATVGIIGFGDIGQTVAKLLTGFGCRILIYNRTHRDTPYGTYVDLETLLTESDFVSIHIAAVPATEHLIDANALKLMKKSAYLVNMARGSIVDEQALYDALKQHDIAGAGLDVFEHEPLPKNDPLMSLDNAYLTPHSAAITHEAGYNMAMGASKMIDAVLSGQTPEWAVNQPVK